MSFWMIFHEIVLTHLSTIHQIKVEYSTVVLIHSHLGDI